MAKYAIHQVVKLKDCEQSTFEDWVAGLEATKSVTGFLFAYKFASKGHAFFEDKAEHDPNKLSRGQSYVLVN